MSINKDQILDAISNMSVMEVMDLISMIEKKFKIDSSLIYSNTNNNLNKNEKIVLKEKTEFDLILKNIGSSKIPVIRTVRSITNLGLKEAKDLVESSPIIIKKNINKNDAEKFKDQLEKVGATIEIK